MFNQRKAAQAAHFFLEKDGGRIPLLKLMKLMYLAERRSLEVRGDSMFDDRALSMDHGPVLSSTYSCINGEIEFDSEWARHVSDRQCDHMLELAEDAHGLELDDLSRRDREILDKVWSDVGHMGKWRIRDHTHEVCEEWEHPSGSAIPISEESILSALGYPASVSREIAEEIAHLREVDSAIGVQ